MVAWLRRGAAGLAAALLALVAVRVWQGCETVSAGDAVVTWRFNGQPIRQGENPCQVFHAERRGARGGTVEISFDGPEPFLDVADCASRESTYPLTLLNGIGGVPWVYARAYYDLPEGRYQVTLRFYDRDGDYVEAIGEVSGELTVEAGGVARLDLDVPLTFGRVDCRWQVSGGCESLGAAATQVALVAAADGSRWEETYLCSRRSTSATPFTPVDPGDYQVEARLLDASGQPLTDWKDAGSLQVEAGTSVEAELTFDASDLL